MILRRLCLSLCLAGSPVLAAPAAASPRIVPVPSEVAGTAEPVRSLDGIWKFTLTPPERFWDPAFDTSGWNDIEVPGECLMQGFNIQRDVEYAYRTTVEVPEDYTGGRVLLRFAGTYSYARVWVNGTYIRDHHGGFTTWDCDITEAVQPGRTAVIAVGITDRSDEISWGSGYAKHNIGGILRSVGLLAVPTDHLEQLHLETDFDSGFHDGILRVVAQAQLGSPSAATLDLRLLDPSGAPVPLVPASLPLADGRLSTSFQLKAPFRWDAEHPNLYELTARLLVDGTFREGVRRCFGFRKVERVGNELHVNGAPVKLLGVDRHDIHPTRGRSVPSRYDRLDVELLKEANVNFVRTSHYPPSEAFLEACDELGMYVEEESAVCFVGTHGNRFTSDAPEFTSRYLSQFAEMIERDRDHPSIIIWSLGNESRWGRNFQQEFEYARSVDPSRPIIFSYPRDVPPGTRAYDILSWHYPDWRENLGAYSREFPVLHDELAHVACYNLETLRRDPNVRNFWGESIRRFAENIYTTQGVLGGAIWGGIDEVFQLPVSDPQVTDPERPEAKYGYGPWGILDGWRRKKPEFWQVKKAYSPLRIEERVAVAADPRAPLVLHVANRFNHTNLRELALEWRTAQRQGRLSLPDIPPASQGEILLPGGEWAEGSTLNLRFLRGDRMIDAFNLPLWLGDRPPTTGLQGEIRLPKSKPAALPKAAPPALEESPKAFTVRGEGFEVVFSRRTGLIDHADLGGRRLLVGGPYIHLGGLVEEAWNLESVQARRTDAAVVVETTGHSGATGLRYEIRIDGDGQIQTLYEFRSAPPFLPPRGPEWQALPPGYDEVGLYFILPAEIDRTAWRRDALWSAYPAGHSGAAEGLARREDSTLTEVYGQEPRHAWSEDTHDFYLFGPDDSGGRGSNAFRMLREYIHSSSALLRGSSAQVRVESNGRQATRLQVIAPGVDQRVRFYILSRWNYPQLGWGNYVHDPVLVDRRFQDRVNLRLTAEDQ